MFSFMSGGDAANVLKALDRSQAVIEFKPDGTIVTANQNFLNALGYQLAEITGKHHSMFVEAAEDTGRNVLPIADGLAQQSEKLETHADNFVAKVRAMQGSTK